MTIIDVPWVKIPQTKFKQVGNGMRGVVFKISPQYVGKIIYKQLGKDKFELRDDKKSLEELLHESRISKKLYEADIGNVPKTIGVERLRILGSAYPTLIMEYITLPRGDKINHVNLPKAIDLVLDEASKAEERGLICGDDVRNPANFFYDTLKNQVRMIDFGRWTDLSEVYPEEKRINMSDSVDSLNSLEDYKI